jgi:hypothetical protein
MDDYAITAADVSTVRNAVIEAQRRADNVASRIAGPWDANMIQAGSAVFGFGPQGPSQQEKAYLTQKYSRMAKGLHGKLRVNLCHTDVIGGAAGLVLRAGPASPVWGDVNLGLEYIRDPANAHEVGWCAFHEFTHHGIGAEDYGYVDRPRFFAGGGVFYPNGVQDPKNNADSLTAFAWSI